MTFHTDCWPLLQYPFTRDKDDNIHDIQDGEEYRNDPFFSVPEHTGLIIMNTDGIPVFKSSKSSLWPILLSVASLPPSIRMNKDYILLAGVWFGPVKPQPAIILPPVLDELRHLHSVGIDVSTRKKYVQKYYLLFVISLRKRSSLTKYSTMAVPTVLMKVYTRIEEWHTFLVSHTDQEHMLEFIEGAWSKILSALCARTLQPLLPEFLATPLIQAFVVNPPLHPYRQQTFVPANHSSRRTSIRNCLSLVHSISISVDKLESLHVLSVDCLKSKCVYSSGVIFRVPNYYEHH